jgi:hypothetical protein
LRQIWSRGVLLAYLERFSPCGGRRWRGGCDGLREAREKAEAGQRGIWRSGSQYGLVASRLAAGRAEEDSVEPRDSTDDQRKAMLRAIHEREGRWDRVDPDTEIAGIGEGIGLSEDQSYELFGQLVDEGFVDPGRAYRAGGAMPGSISRIDGREENMTVIGDELRLTDKGRSEVG